MALSDLSVGCHSQYDPEAHVLAELWTTPAVLVAVELELNQDLGVATASHESGSDGFAGRDGGPPLLVAACDEPHIADRIARGFRQRDAGVNIRLADTPAVPPEGGAANDRYRNQLLA